MSLSVFRLGLRHAALGALALSIMTWQSPAQAQTVISSGHVDIDVEFDAPDTLELGVHSNQHYAASDVIFEVGMGGYFTRTGTTMGTSAFDFIGADSFWIIPQDPNLAIFQNIVDVPDLGISAEELTSASGWQQGTNGRVTYSLKSVSGPGFFSVFTGVTGTPELYMTNNPSVGNLNPTALRVLPGGHRHFNFAFSQAGTYKVEITASGSPRAGVTLSQTEIFTFRVVPEPTSMVLMGLGCGAMGFVAVRRNRRATA